MTLTTKFNHKELSDEQLNTSIAQILDKNTLGAMASQRGNKAHINTAYFVYGKDLTLYFLSQPTDIHCTNIRENDSVAVAIWTTPTQWGKDLQGVQLFGTCKQLKVGKELIKAMGLFLKKFPAFKSIMQAPGEFAQGVASRMYAIKVDSLKLLDEPSFGRRKYISCEVKKC